MQTPYQRECLEVYFPVYEISRKAKGLRQRALFASGFPVSLQNKEDRRENLWYNKKRIRDSKETCGMTGSILQKVTKAITLVKDYTNEVIESSVIEYVCANIGKRFCYQGALSGLKGQADDTLMHLFDSIGFPVDIEFVVGFFEALLEKETIEENGIVFTPNYIADYINAGVLKNMDCSRVRSVDPGCGCGIFLVSAAEKMREKSGKPIVDILNENIYGMDIDGDNVRRCTIVLHLFALMTEGSNEGLAPNLVCCDSLKEDWRKLFGVESFDCVIGNPPYVNPHDMSKETASFLKKTFRTTKTGVYNIFYAFVEYGMNFLSEKGMLGYIVPNNFLTIKSAKELRELLAENRWVELIIDFADNMVFKPVRTYNCILLLSKQQKEDFAYCVMDKTEDISFGLNRLQTERMEFACLDSNGWQLVDKKTRENIGKIEGQSRSIKEFIRTGIATLRDEIYMVHYDGKQYYKEVSGVRYDMEPELVKRLYKIPELKQSGDIASGCRYIIFPYRKGKNGFEIIPEEELREQAPQIYRYLLARKPELDGRDKGKPNPVAWYAYGRSQGLNKYGKKLLFPTFAGTPRFTMVEDEAALFCNGYAIFENEEIALELLQRVLNSVVMQYYVKHTSYAIEGGYYCYQKKYIERFSLPQLSEEEIERMRKMGKEALDVFLIEKYELDL